MAIHSFFMLRHKLRKAGIHLDVQQTSQSPWQRRLGISHVDGYQFSGKNKHGNGYNVQIRPDGMFTLGESILGHDGKEEFTRPPKKIDQILRSYKPYQKNIKYYKKTYNIPNIY